MKTRSRVHLFMLFALLWGVNVCAQQSLRESYIEEFAQLAAHIVSNGHMNGEVIRLDGALRMAPR